MAAGHTLFIGLLLTFAALSGRTCDVDGARVRNFPKEFFFGVSTSSYQVEGGWNATDKGENIWDNLVHTQPWLIKDGSSGDVSSDSYHHYERDVEMLHELGVDFYRFSLSWSRLFPSGFTAEYSKDGLDYYNNLINSMLEKNIVPMIVLHHWDLPQPLQALGGWPNVLLADFFEHYARRVFEMFGDRVKLWATFNEPNIMCVEGYGNGLLAPMLNTSGIADYMCGHTVLLAHSKVYRMYDREFRKKQKGMIGIILHAYWSEPVSQSYEDISAAEQSFAFNFGWMTHPILSTQGDYPAVMRKRIASRSSRQKFSRSRLPVFAPREARELAGSADFLGLAHSASRLVRAPLSAFVVPETPSFSDDRGVTEYLYNRKKWPSAKWLRTISSGFRKVLNWIRKEYRDPEVIVMGPGFPTAGGLRDKDRMSHMNLFLNAIVDAIEDGCNVKAFSAWTLMDGFAWTTGYTKKYGLYEVDFSSPNRTRTIRDSGKMYADIIQTRSLFYEEMRCSDCDVELTDDYNDVET